MVKYLISNIVIYGLLIGIPRIVEAGDLLVIDELWAGLSIVSGKAAPGSTPIVIYDLSFPVRTSLGSGKSMDDNGNFAVLVSPPLIAGHEIVAVDKEGNTSQPVVVSTPISPQ